MGLLDVLNGMRNGPRGGQRDAGSSSGMSPITLAILALLAYKGIKHFGGSRGPAPSTNPARIPGSNPVGTEAQGGGLGDLLGSVLGGGRGGGALAGAPGGSLGDLLQGGLGGLLAGGAAGSILSGGLGGLLDQFQQNGQGQAAGSWVGKGPNQDISEGDLARSIGNDDLDALSQHTGLSRDELLAGLRRELPGAIDELTPDGRVPTGEEVSRWV
jgi:uncharacterized protein YidB (DUF937 family)